MLFSLPLSSQAQSPFFSLPTELQIYIVDLSLLSSKRLLNPASTHVGRTSWDQQARQSIPPLGVALLATCQRARIELPIRAIFSNEFTFTSPMAVMALTDSIRSSELQLVTSLTLSWSATNLVAPPEGGDHVLVDHWEDFFGRNPRPYPAHINSPGYRKPPSVMDLLPHVVRLRIDIDGMYEFEEKNVYWKFVNALDRVLDLDSLNPWPSALEILEVTATGSEILSIAGQTREEMQSTGWGVVPFWMRTLDSGLLPLFYCSMVIGQSEDNWVGLLRNGKRFSLAALPGPPTAQQTADLGYTSATSWEETMELVAIEEHSDNPDYDFLY